MTQYRIEFMQRPPGGKCVEFIVHLDSDAVITPATAEQLRSDIGRTLRDVIHSRIVPIPQHLSQGDQDVRDFCNPN